MSARSDWIRLLVKYTGKCSECGKEISTGEYALWSRSLKSIKHINCKGTEPKDAAGGTGKSANTIRKSVSSQIDAYGDSKIEDVADCFICNRSLPQKKDDLYSTGTTGVYICDGCLQDPEAYLKYQDNFSKKAKRVAKVKI